MPYIIIAGASRGLGRHFAKIALNEGYSVCLLARDVEGLKSYQKELLEQHPNLSVEAYPVDLTDEQSVTSVFKLISKQCNEIKALVNCAATWTGGKSINEISAADMQRSLDLNFFAIFNVIKSFLALPEKNKSESVCIVNLGATASIRGNPKMAAFSAPKCALRSFSQSLAKELGPEGIHICHMIIDGLLNNERTRALNPDLPEDRFIDMTSVAKNILSVIEQDRSCWTFEWDVRPFNESW